MTQYYYKKHKEHPRICLPIVPYQHPNCCVEYERNMQPKFQSYAGIRLPLYILAFAYNNKKGIRAYHQLSYIASHAIQVHVQEKYQTKEVIICVTIEIPFVSTIIKKTLHTIL